MPEDMKFKNNGGVDPVTLDRGYTKLEGDPPHSGESITNPRHVQERKQMEKLRAEYGWPDMEETPNGPDGFLERDLPTPFDRPNRGDTEDRG